MKKVLIVSMTCGEGHDAIARSLSKQIELKGGQAKIVQLFEYDKKRVQRENKIFLWACKYIPKSYNFFWKKLTNTNFEKRDTCSIHKTLKKAQENLIKTLLDYKPDVVLTVHTYAGVALSNIKRSNKWQEMYKDTTPPKTIGFVTDYSMCPYWQCAIGLDQVIVPHKDLIKDMTDRGFDKKNIFAFGYPIAQKFSKTYNKKQCRKNLGIDDKFTVMLTNGGNGVGNTLKLIKNILKYNPDCQVICINGRNEKTKARIDKYIEKSKITNILNLGFVNNIEECMSSCDLLVSKPGGNFLSEAVCLERPLILREKAIINEQVNKQLFISKNMAVGMNKITDAGKLVLDLKNNPKKLKEMSKACQKFFEKNGIENITNFILNQ
ncbi:MAG: hypothetical protein IJD48_03180 [Clostridia bacterium]|nr:hypothetical protein [Clostridia bacterium]